MNKTKKFQKREKKDRERKKDGTVHWEIGDPGTPERHNQKSLEITLINNIPKCIVKNISPLHTYYKRGQLNIAQFSAGTKLYECYVTAWVGRNSYEVKEYSSKTDKPMEVTEKQIHAMGEYAKGLKASSRYQEVIQHVCINENPISSMTKHWYNRKKKKDELRKGLTSIAQEYGFE